MPQFNESDHPRASNGEFGSGGGEGSSSSSSSGEYPWEEGDKLEAAYSEASRAIKAAGANSGGMGLTPEAVKSTPEYQEAKKNLEKSQSALQAFNARWSATYAKIPKEERMRRRNAKRASDITAMDATLRTYDKDGRLHIARSHISKACVNPYYGREIPRSQGLGLDPNQIYMMLRHPDELAKAAPTFARLPILAKHTPISNFDSLDEKEKKKYIVGTIGSDVEFLEPFLDADVSIWDADAIAGIETEQQCEFSCGYSYEPIMTTGNYNGENYDGIMTQIHGNHLALVTDGRAGSEVRAADSKLLEKKPMKRSKLGNALIVALTTAFPKVQIATDSELEKALAPATRKTFGTSERESASKLILAMDSGIDQKQVFAVMDALSDMDNDTPEPAKDKRKGKDSKGCDECSMPEGKHADDCKMGKDAAAEEEKEKKAAEDKKAAMLKRRRTKRQWMPSSKRSGLSSAMLIRRSVMFVPSLGTWLQWTPPNRFTLSRSIR
jgi:hypothetical protein